MNMRQIVMARTVIVFLSLSIFGTVVPQNNAIAQSNPGNPAAQNKQTVQAKPKKGNKTLNKANELFEVKAYAEAIPIYESILKIDSTSSEAILNLAECYRLTNNTAKALEWFAKAVNLKTAPPIYKYYYGQMLMKTNNYGEARKWLSQYTADSRGANQVAAIDQQQQLLKYKDFYIVERLSDTVNSDQNDFAPVIFNRSLVFASSRPTSAWIEREHTWTDRNFYTLYQAKQSKATRTWTEPKPFTSKVNTKFNDGPVCFSSDGRTMYFTRNNLAGSSAQMSEDGFVKLKICKIELDEKDNFIDEVTELPFNNKEYNYAHPAISYDDRVLYFSSDMPGGLGGMDLWMVKIENGKWGTPMNLGSNINTAGNEVFPYVEDNGKLYFSSDGLGGLGGLDIFEAIGMGSTWNVRNLGAPINSSGDDFGITFEDYLNGYFSSNRGGLSQNDDIYRFEQVKVKKHTFSLELFDNKTGEKLSGKVNILDRQTGKTTTIDVKNGWVEVELDAAHTMKMDAYVDNYKTDSIVVFTDTKNPKFEIKLNKTMQLYLDALVLNNPKDKKPVEGATVTLLLENGTAKTVTTGADGHIPRQELEAENKYNLTASFENKVSDKAPVSTMFQTESKVYEQTIYIDNNGALCLFGTITDKSLKGAPAEGVTVSISDVATGIKLYETITPSNGTFKTCEVEVGKTYRIAVVKPGYFAKSEEVTVTADQKADLESRLEIDRIVIGKAIKIDNIYFDVSKSVIRPDAAKELDKIVRLMQENPELVIELSSHTDCRSSAASNLSLSDKRAKSSAQYIIDHGIDAKRITGKGYGESQLVNKCECEGSRNVACTEKEHQENRRTEFKVVGFLRNGVIYNANGTAIQPQ